MRLEAAAATAPADTIGYPFALRPTAGLILIDPAPLWAPLAADLAAGERVGIIAARFHAGFADALSAQVIAVGARAGDVVALTGGTFQNKRLARLVRERLVAEGLKVLEHAAIPANDGGLAVGQAAVAIARALPAERRAG